MYNILGIILPFIYFNLWVNEIISIIASCYQTLKLEVSSEQLWTKNIGDRLNELFPIQFIILYLNDYLL